MPNANEYLRHLAGRLAKTYAALPQTKAVLLAGSVAEGLGDYYSDLDLTVYYDNLPSEEELAQVRQQNGGGEIVWKNGSHSDGGFAEAYMVDGIECQFCHTTIATWERTMAEVIEQLQVDSVNQKALEGTVHGLPLHGEMLIRKWKERLAQYSDDLAEAMVLHYLRFNPIWYLHDRLVSRDASLWRYGALVENTQNLLGVLAGLNHLYYTPFQFKRLRRFAGQMRFAPLNLAARLEQMFVLGAGDSLQLLEQLVEETIALVEQHMPQVDTSRVRRRLGHRVQPWKPIRSKDIKAG